MLGPVTENARRLFVLLHVCGPKGTAGEEWVKSLQTILTSTQKTADRVFRALVEDWRPPRERIDGLQATSYSEVVSDQRSVPLALLGWTGIYAGVERLDGLLHTVKAFIASITSAPVVLLMSNIMNLVDRVLSALQPNSAKSSRNRPEISRDEREGLFAALPQLHVTAMGILSRVILRLDHGFAATSHIALDEIFWVLDNESHDDKIRKAAYEVVSQILRLFGPSLPRPHATSLSRCIKLACADLLPSAEISSQEGEAFVPNGKKSVNGARSSNADSYLKTAETRSQVPSGSADVVEAARRLLPLTLTNLPSGFLSYATRCQIDRTAILTNDKEAMLASIMNPPISAKGQKTASSIIPLLARAYPEAPEVEALLRPQMPMLQSRCRNGETTASDEEEDLYQQISRTKSDLDVTYGDNSGLNGGTNVERNVADHESADKQVFTGIKGIEQLVEATDLSSRFAVSYVPGKRDREDDLDLEAREDKGTAATSGSVEIKDVESPSKKVRLIYSTTTAVEGLKSTPPAIQVDKNLEETAFVPSTTTPTAAGALGTRYDEGQGDSDESDFVMPTLNLEPDTDEEEGDEDEDDG